MLIFPKRELQQWRHLMGIIDMKDIAIYGAGGFGKEVACLIQRINDASSEPEWNLIGFFDDGKTIGEPISHYGPVLGGILNLNSWTTDLSITIAIGTPSTRRKIHERIRNKHISFPNIIDPNFKIVDPKTFTIGNGNVIQGGCFVSCDVCIGDFNVLNGSIVLGHDCLVGDYNVLMPNIRISGNVTIGNENLIGVGSIIIQKLHIGNNVTLGAGCVLLNKPKNGRTYIGNPAKLFKY